MHSINFPSLIVPSPIALFIFVFCSIVGYVWSSLTDAFSRLTTTLQTLVTQLPTSSSTHPDSLHSLDDDVELQSSLHLQAEHIDMQVVGSAAPKSALSSRQSSPPSSSPILSSSLPSHEPGYLSNLHAAAYKGKEGGSM